MSLYKNIVEILSSLASLIAIIGVLISWYRSSRKPLKIERVVIHKKETESTYILIVKNRKDYPVEIKSTNCYKKRIYNIEKKNKQEPEYSELLRLTDSLFINSERFEIGANGHTDIRIKGQNINGKVSRLLFSINTSHGYHELWCKSILVVEIGKTEVYGLEHRYEYESKYKARIKYYWLKVKDIFCVKELTIASTRTG